jgi:hypothetical protein
MPGWLVMAAAVAELAVSVPAPRETAPSGWYALAAESHGDETLVVGQAGYEAEPVAVSVAVSHRAFRGYTQETSVSALAGRRLDGRTRLDLQVWRDVGRGGGGLGFTLRRTLGPKGR